MVQIKKASKAVNICINYFLVILGTFLLAFGTVIFLTKCELVSGGLSGIGILVQHQFPDIILYDYVVSGLTVIFWIIGLIFLGKDFAIKTGISSLAYIGFTFLFNRVEAFNTLAFEITGITQMGQIPATGNMILCGLFGGIFIGAGCAITFIGGGSTGGVDVITMMAEKFLNIKASITSFVIDAVVIIVGLIVMRMPVQGLCGILSSFFSAILIEGIYIRFQTSYQVDIISEKWEEISRYVQDEMGRGATIIPIKGGYKGDDRVMLRVVFSKNEYEQIREYIAKVDSNAFVTFTQTNAVFGEGFKRHFNLLRSRRKKSKNQKNK